MVAGGQEGYGAADELRAVEKRPCRFDIRLAGQVSRSDLDALNERFYELLPDFNEPADAFAEANAGR